MAPFKFDEKYRKTDEYKILYSQFKSINPTLPHYLVEVGIILHKANPLLYKHHNNKKVPSDEPFVIEGASITVEDSKILSENSINETCIESV